MRVDDLIGQPTCADKRLPLRAWVQTSWVPGRRGGGGEGEGRGVPEYYAGVSACNTFASNDPSTVACTMFKQLLSVAHTGRLVSEADPQKKSVPSLVCRVVVTHELERMSRNSV